MNIILLSGGSGKRLWPLSNDVRSKQFIKLFKNNDEYESMVQRVYRQITTVEANAKITIATSKSQASAIKNQLGEKASICVEPCRRDTFPAIALAAAFPADIRPAISFLYSLRTLRTQISNLVTFHFVSFLNESCQVSVLFRPVQSTILCNLSVKTNIKK